MKEYKVVPGPMGYEIKAGHADEAFADFAEIINNNCSSGWDYHSMETISITENPGCGGGGDQNAKTTVYYMLIFVREKPLPLIETVHGSGNPLAAQDGSSMLPVAGNEETPEAETEAMAICPFCSHPIPPDAENCPKCGVRCKPW